MAYREESVARRDELRNGEMRQVCVGETDVLLVRWDDRFFAYQANCTHYGGPLAEGVLSDGRIVCPWHHACFRATSGYQIEPPGLDSLEAYDVRLDGDDIVVRVPDEPAGYRRVQMTGRDRSDGRTFVVLGGGAAGEYAVEAVREKGFRGRLVMITREAETPYDRPNCSKDYLQDAAPEEWMFLRPAAFYEERDIERMHGRTVTRLDPQSKTLTFDDGDTLDFDGLIVCTGGIPRTPDLPGLELPGVFTLRSYQDANAILNAGKKAMRAVVVGASFIGMEVAFSLRKLGVKHVTVTAPESVPFEKPFGERIGKMVLSVHEENGVTFRMRRNVREFKGDGRLQEVVLKDGSRLEADLAVVGIGVRPATDFVEGLGQAEDGSIMVDDHLQAADGIFAAGDIAQFPDWRTGRRIRVEHWRLACQHGRLAGYNLAGDSLPYRSVPYFWTVHFGTNIRYVGHAASWDEIIYDGNPEDREYIAFYVERGTVLAASGCGRDQEMAAIEELMRRDRVPALASLRKGGVDYVSLLGD